MRKVICFIICLGVLALGAPSFAKQSPIVGTWIYLGGTFIFDSTGFVNLQLDQKNKLLKVRSAGTWKVIDESENIIEIKVEKTQKFQYMAPFEPCKGVCASKLRIANSDNGLLTINKGQSWSYWYSPAKFMNTLSKMKWGMGNATNGPPDIEVKFTTKKLTDKMFTNEVKLPAGYERFAPMIDDVNHPYLVYHKKEINLNKKKFEKLKIMFLGKLLVIYRRGENDAYRHYNVWTETYDLIENFGSLQFGSTGRSDKNVEMTLWHLK